MPPVNGFNSIPDFRWTNQHQTIDTVVDQYFIGENQGITDKYADYNATTKRIQDLIQRAIDKDKRLRALGAGWSLTEVALTDGFLLETKPLNHAFQLGPNDLDPAYHGAADNLLFVQCGGKIKELNRVLKTLNKSLKTSGSSNGQTIAGALSTGTHGSAFSFGSFPELVVGLHLIVGPNRHVWLQRQTAPVINQQWADRFGTVIISDDDLFNAALVSFGSFGVIHGVLIEVEPLYLLEAHLQWLPLENVLKNTIRSLDFDDLPLPHRPERPFHFEVIINPNDDPARKVYVKSMYKRPYTPNYQPPVHDINGRANGDDALSILARIATLVPFAQGQFNQKADEEYAEFGPQLGTIGEIFSQELVRGKVLSVAMAMPLASALDALNIALTTHKQMHLLIPTLISLRYVKGSKATLAYTRFEQTCLLELDGVDTHEAQLFRNNMWNAMAASGIPYTFHWGKMNNLDADMVRKMYGNAADKWVLSRHQLLETPARNVFNNKLLENLGLAH